MKTRATFQKMLEIDKNALSSLPERNLSHAEEEKKREFLEFHINCLEKPSRVICTLGSGSVTNSYVIKRGTNAECEDYFNALPSLRDPGWGDAHLGTNPYREACQVEEV